MSARSKCNKALLGVCALMVIVLAFGSTSLARVSRIEITERVSFAGGMEFGEVGPYEKLKGRLYYAVDPDNRYNKQIVDLQLAKTGQLRQDISIVHSPTPGPGYVEEIVGEDARNRKGEVEFWGDFILLKPVDLSKGNGRLFYEVNNRGNIPGLTITMPWRPMIPPQCRMLATAGSCGKGIRSCGPRGTGMWRTSLPTRRATRSGSSSP